MFLNLKISQKGLILVAVPLIFELFFVAVLVSMQNQSEAEIKREVRSRTIVAHTNILLNEVLATGTSISTYGLSVRFKTDKAREAANRYGEMRGKVLNEFEVLSTLIAGHNDQATSLRKVRDIYDEYDKLIERMRQVFDNKDQEDAFKRNLIAMRGLLRLNDLLEQMRTELGNFTHPEEIVEQESPQAQARNRAFVQNLLFVGIAFNIALAVALAIYFTRDVAARLNVINSNTRRLAKGEALIERVGGTDEIAHVDSVFHEMARKLKEADRLKKEFVGIISHELRTPLTSIQALLTVLEAGVLGDLPEKTKVRIRGAEADVERLIHLINELLDIEKMESGRLEMLYAETSLGDVLSRSLGSVRAIADRKQIALVAPEITESIVADSDRLVQVIVNILSNAIKFSNEGSSIEVELLSKASGIEFRIIDHGRGIPKEHRDAIFDRYKQVELDDERHKGGSGLGLAICKAIVEQHGGTIGVDSAEGKGSTFWFTIPRNIQSTAKPKRTVTISGR